jgi:predicted nucleic acid-binding Zn ribbon protein
LAGILVASPGQCPICGTPLHGREKCCSGKCRAIKSRRKRILIERKDLQEIRRALVSSLEAVWEAKATLDRHLGG